MENAKPILKQIVGAGGSPYFVGGCVRDLVLGLQPKDIDIEVFGVSPEVLHEVLRGFGKVDAVGASFGVLKLKLPDGSDLDFSLPRRESKVGAGHRGFMVQSDPSMTIKEAAARRDFTINAMSMTIEGSLIDPFGGKSDLENKILRHTSEHFSEDPLRVLRAFQFAARFGFRVASETVNLCRGLSEKFSELAPERVWGEFEKWCLKGVKPSLGLRFLKESGWLQHFPALSEIVDCPQDPLWHPEGDVFEHTCFVVDSAAEIATRDNFSPDNRIVLMLAAALHDVGKPVTTTQNPKGRWVAPAHPRAGTFVAKPFLRNMSGLELTLQSKVLNLIDIHMDHLADRTSRGVRRFVHKRLGVPIELFSAIVEADHSGRPPLPKGLPQEAIGLIQQVRFLQSINAEKPLIQGRDLIPLGIVPGPRMGEILRECLEMQIEEGLSKSELLERVKVMSC